MGYAARILIAIALTAPASADEIRLAGGGTLRGRVVERTETHVVVEVGPGRVTLPMSRVVSVESGLTALDVWHQRSAGLLPGDADGWLSLGLWARDQGLHTQANEAFQKVLVVQPRNPVANAALGRVRLGDRWVSADESYRARGYVRYRGRWITPEEHALEIAERRAEVEEQSRRAEADARVREAEARARAAEARADAADSVPVYPGPWSPSPVGLVIGTVIGPHPGHRPPPPAPAPPPEPPRRSPTRTRSIR